jgi:hypothetical protein
LIAIEKPELSFYNEWRYYTPNRTRKKEDLMNKSEIINAMKKARVEWNGLLGQIPEERMTEPGANGEWSVKDVIAHLTFFENEMVTVLEQRALTGTPGVWELPTDEANAMLYEQRKDYPLAQVLADSRQAYERLLALTEAAPESDFEGPSSYAEMPPDWTLEAVLSGNSWDHYYEHIGWLREWLDAS